MQFAIYMQDIPWIRGKRGLKSRIQLTTTLFAHILILLVVGKMHRLIILAKGIPARKRGIEIKPFLHSTVDLNESAYFDLPCNTLESCVINEKLIP